MASGLSVQPDDPYGGFVAAAARGVYQPDEVQRGRDNGQRSLIGLALDAAWPQRQGRAGQIGLALGGILALRALGDSLGSTWIELFTNHNAHDAAHVAVVVDSELWRAGWTAQRLDTIPELQPALSPTEPVAVWAVFVPAGTGTELGFLQISRAERYHDGVFIPEGDRLAFVLHPEDAAAGLMSNMVRRGLPGDYLAVARLLESSPQRNWTALDLIGFAQRVRPGLDRQAFELAGARLEDREWLTASGDISPDDVTRLRDQFTQLREALGNRRAHHALQHADTESAPPDGGAAGTVADGGGAASARSSRRPVRKRNPAPGARRDTGRDRPAR